MSKPVIDILMITYNRPQYTRLALTRLLETCDEQMRVWLWQNGSDPETLAVVNELKSHPRVYKFHHSLENTRLRKPTNWMWEQADGQFVCKVDDDCMMPYGWGDTLRQAHADNPQFGAVGCWRFFEEDFIPEAANKKIREFNGGHKLMVNCWVEGSGYVLKRECLNKLGVLKENQSWVQYCIEVAAAGYINGWYYPFLFQEHMDDPRSEHTLLKTDEDLKKYMPLSAEKNGAPTLKEWQEQLRRSARIMQHASTDPRQWTGWRRKLRNVKQRVKSLFGDGKQW